MGEPRTFRVKSRLSSMVFAGGGVTVAEALTRAEAKLAALRAPSLAAMDAAISEISARYGPAARGRAGESFDDLYRLCTDIIDVAMFAPGSGVEEVARSFCAVADLSQIAGVWAWDAVDLHIASLAVLRAAGGALSHTQRRALLDGLAQVALKRGASGS